MPAVCEDCGDNSSNNSGEMQWWQTNVTDIQAGCNRNGCTNTDIPSNLKS